MSRFISKSQMVVAGTLCLLAVGVAVTLAQDGEEGQIIQIGPDNAPLAPDGADPLLRRDLDLFPGNPDDLARQARAASPYYIGVGAHKVEDSVRAHVDLPEGVGLIISQIAPDSPAEESRLQKHDILVRADGKELKDVGDLIEVVEDHAGDTMDQFTLDIIRGGQAETVWVTPADRPKSPVVNQPGFGLDPRQRDLLNNPLPPLDQEALEQLFPGLGERMQMRGNLGPFQQQFDLNQVPDGVSVNIQRQNDEPAKIVVKRGDETWEVEGDDEQALAELPEDLRPMVENLLNNPAQPQFDPFSNADLEERMRQMEEDMQRMREQMNQQFDR